MTIFAPSTTKTVNSVFVIYIVLWCYQFIPKILSLWMQDVDTDDEMITETSINNIF